MSRFRSITVDVDVYIGDFDDCAVVKEATERGYQVIASPLKIAALKEKHGRIPDVLEDRTPALEDELEYIRAAIVRGTPADALIVIDRLLQPKYRNVAACKEAYEKLRKAAA